MVATRVGAVLVAGWLLAGEVPAADPGGVVDPVAPQGAAGEEGPPASGLAWRAYATAQATTYEAARKAGDGNGSPDDFIVEGAARKALASAWRQSRAGGSPPADAYLDQLVAIDDAGFIDEYVLSSLANPGWVVPAVALDGLDLPAFWRWANANVPGIASSPSAGIEAGADTARPVVPGADLPDPEGLSPGRRPCAELLAPLRSAVAAWEAQAAVLPGAPVSAVERGQFVVSLAVASASEPFTSRGVVWVSTRPAELAFLAGYCAVDVQDYALAEGFLARSVALMPLDPGPKLELTQALIGQGKFDQADALVGEIMDSTDDPCRTAQALRKRGYIRFEQGLLEEARAAYRKSLEYDPTSPVARSELEVLNAEIGRTGGKSEPYQPPPTEQLTTSGCGN
ncbi:MAG: tetratricopeptide repeat protein [Chromatiales bacterium]|nr:tetratricopeptide repeat protein [Chromatiales bacterium]